MTVPKVVLIGGPPFVGKSSVACYVAGRLGYGCICTDDIAKAIRAVTTVQTHPGIHAMDDADYQDYFTRTSVEALIEHSRRSQEIIWPGLEKIIRTHAACGDPLVMEGYALWPAQVMAADFSSTRAVWLTCDDQLLEARIRTQTSFYRGALDEEALIANILSRSNIYNELMIKSAVACGATLISVKVSHTVEDVADLCMLALTGV
jgi:2-phosphoglycerate kinase